MRLRAPPRVRAGLVRAGSFLAALALAAGALGCSTDTQLGLEVTIDGAAVRVVSDAGGDRVDAELGVTYRVGPYSPSSSAFQPNAIQLYTGTDLVFDGRATTPTAFQAGVMPGQSRQTTLTATSTSVATPRALCGSEVQVLLTWRDPIASTIGMSSSTATVACP